MITAIIHQCWPFHHQLISFMAKTSRPWTAGWLPAAVACLRCLDRCYSGCHPGTRNGDGRFSHCNWSPAVPIDCKMFQWYEDVLQSMITSSPVIYLNTVSFDTQSTMMWMMWVRYSAKNQAFKSSSVGYSIIICSQSAAGFLHGIRNEFSFPPATGTTKCVPNWKSSAIAAIAAETCYLIQPLAQSSLGFDIFDC